MSPGRKSCGFCTSSDSGCGVPFVRFQIDPVTTIFYSHAKVSLVSHTTVSIQFIHISVRPPNIRFWILTQRHFSVSVQLEGIVLGSGPYWFISYVSFRRIIYCSGFFRQLFFFVIIIIIVFGIGFGAFFVLNYSELADQDVA